MFLRLWEEYYEFFIILIGIIIGMVIAYIIFFRPNNARNKRNKLKNDKAVDNSDDNVDLSFEATDDDLDEEYLSIVDQEEFVLGENSNILESLDANELESTEDTEKLPVDEFEDRNSFETEAISEPTEITPEPLEDIETYVIEEKDTEKRLDKIVREVIPLNDYANQNIGKYHVLFRKDDKRWYVKREGKEEIEKFLVTQKEAIAFATIQALIYDTTIVVHDEDGKIGKYDF
jgi:hypothetical protein